MVRLIRGSEARTALQEGEPTSEGDQNRWAVSLVFPFGGGGVELDRLALGKARDALSEAVLFDQLGAAHTIFGFG